ncbi:MAG: aminoacyl-tRNA hydrolase [Acidobacteriota bacterium]
MTLDAGPPGGSIGESAPVSLLAGLGNAGARYEGTRHNFGFEAVERIAGVAGARWRGMAHGCLIAEATLGGKRIVLAKPQTFMNLGGTAVGELARARSVAPSGVMVFFDDIALPLGTVRIREGGSHGGHRGLQSVLEALASQEVPRVRLGIRPEELPEDLAGFVLRRFSPEERATVEEVLDRVVAATRTVLTEGMPKAMSLYNRAPAIDDEGGS